METKEDLLFRFKEHLAALGRSPATLKSYHDHLKLFLEAIDETDMKKVTRSTITAYIAGLYKYRTPQGRPYSIATICLKVRTIKRFFEFLEGANIIFIDPAETVKEPPKQRRLPKKILTRKETLKLFDQPNLGTLAGIRDRSILEVFDSTGIRLRELCRLSIYDADLTGAMLRINNGKGKKDRVVPMGKHAVRFLKEYIARVRPHYTQKNRTERRLFVDVHGKGIGKQAVRVMVKKYGRAAGIKTNVTPHVFRHGFATGLINNGADITAVQKMLGHADLSTTQVYIRCLGLEIKKTHQKTHPREKDHESVFVPDIKRRLPNDIDN